MSIVGQVSVNAHYTRSVNLERDGESLDMINAYIPTSRAIRTFERITSAFHHNQAPRAWSLVGPYGSGKSSFSVFLSHLLSADGLVTTNAAQKILKKTEPQLSKKFANQIKGNNGYLKILVTGGPEPMAKRLVQGMHNAAETYWKPIKKRKPKIIADLEKAAMKKSVSATDVIDLLEKLQGKLQETDCQGILFMIDELGKFLEYEARHYGANDIYLLQALAEHACEGNAVNLYLFVLLHQSFEQYAKGLGESLKKEWSKVQGRFEELPFLESAEQVLRVVSSAFVHEMTKAEVKTLRNKTEKIVDVFIEKEAIPSALNRREALDLFAACYPLHPVSAILLPLLCQKVAQNERTLFSYLGSHEEYGLQDMLNKLTSLDECIQPHHIYDYFISNQPAVMGDYLTHRRWAEVVTAIERLGDANQEEVNLLKTIGILNIIGSKGGFKSSKALLGTCAKNKAAQKRTLESLTEKSIVNYRKFNSEYRVWQGSDFDLEAAFQEEVTNIGNFSLADELNAESDMQPIVARRYTIENGTLRYFVPVFVDAQSYKNIEQKGKEARIIFYLASGQDDEKSFRNTVSSHFSDLDIVALCLSGSQLREVAAETLALKHVLNRRQELNTDPVARREFDDRLTAAEQTQKILLQNLIDTPASSEWWNRGVHLNVNNKRALQVNLSNILKDVYNKAPVIRNELINRDKPSSQAIAARNKLLYGMLHNEKFPDLGIDKFPPEKAIYRAVLLNSGIHIQQGSSKEWTFTEPKGNIAGKNGSNIKPVWQRIDAFLAETEQKPQSFVELNEELQAPPYGVKAGLLPILYIAVYILNQHELAIYEKRVYRPYFTEEMLDRFVKRPDEFTIQRFRIEGVRSDLFKKYGEVIEKKDGTEPTLIDLAKPLASFMGHLPEYTKKTQKGLSEKVKDVRQAFNLSKSPERLLFEQLPKALGYNLEDKNSDLEGFSQRLKDALSELKRAYDHLLKRQIKLLANATKVDAELSLSEMRKQIYGRYVGLENYTVDTEGLRAFIMRLTKATTKDKDWLENILMFLGRKPTYKWLDFDQDLAEYRLSNFSKNLLDLQKIRLYENDRAENNDADFDVYLLRSFKKGGDMKDEVVTIDQRQLENVKDLRLDIAGAFSKITDKELKLAVLVELVDELLTDYRETKKAIHSNKKTPQLKEVN